MTYRPHRNHHDVSRRAQPDAGSPTYAVCAQEATRPGRTPNAKVPESDAPTGRKHGRTESHGSRMPLLAAALSLILGLSLIAYPSVSDLLAQAERDKVTSAQQQTVQRIKTDEPEELTAQIEAARAYNVRLAQGLTVVTDPFDADEATQSDLEYLSTLNVAGDGVMATLVIPSIGVNLPIYHTVEEDVLQKGAGHMPGTALPVGGPSTHSVLAGHTGLPATKIFDSLDQLQIGDYFFIEVMGETHAYQVDKIDVVLPEQTDGLAVVDGVDLVTLVTCTPYGVNSHRLLVRGTRCEVPEGWLDEDGSLSSDALSSTEQRTSPEILKNSLTGIAIGVGAAGTGGMAALLASRLKRKRNRKRNRRAKAVPSTDFVSRYEYEGHRSGAHNSHAPRSEGAHFAPKSPDDNKRRGRRGRR